MSTFQLTCEQAQALMMETALALPSDEFLLNAEDETRLERHLTACDECQAYQNSMKSLTVSLRSLDIPVPAGLADRIMQAVESDEVPHLPTVKPANRFRWLMASAAAVLLLFVTLPETDRQPAEQPLAAKKPVLTKTEIAAKPAPEPLASVPQVERVQETAISTSKPDEAPLAYAVDTSQLASARPDADSLDILAFAGNPIEPEGMNDPVGDLVGF